MKRLLVSMLLIPGFACVHSQTGKEQHFSLKSEHVRSFLVEELNHHLSCTDVYEMPLCISEFLPLRQRLLSGLNDEEISLDEFAQRLDLLREIQDESTRDFGIISGPLLGLGIGGVGKLGKFLFNKLASRDVFSTQNIATVGGIAALITLFGKALEDFLLSSYKEKVKKYSEQVFKEKRAGQIKELETRIDSLSCYEKVGERTRLRRRKKEFVAFKSLIAEASGESLRFPDQMWYGLDVQQANHGSLTFFMTTVSELKGCADALAKSVEAKLKGISASVDNRLNAVDLEPLAKSLKTLQALLATLDDCDTKLQALFQSLKKSATSKNYDQKLRRGALDKYYACIKGLFMGEANQPWEYARERSGLTNSPHSFALRLATALRHLYSTNYPLATHILMTILFESEPGECAELNLLFDDLKRLVVEVVSNERVGEVLRSFYSKHSKKMKRESASVSQGEDLFREAFYRIAPLWFGEKKVVHLTALSDYMRDEYYKEALIPYARDNCGRVCELYASFECVEGQELDCQRALVLLEAFEVILGPKYPENGCLEQAVEDLEGRVNELSIRLKLEHLSDLIGCLRNLPHALDRVHRNPKSSDEERIALLKGCLRKEIASITSRLSAIQEGQDGYQTVYALYNTLVQISTKDHSSEEELVSEVEAFSRAILDEAIEALRCEISLLYKPDTRIPEALGLVRQALYKKRESARRDSMSEVKQRLLARPRSSSDAAAAFGQASRLGSLPRHPGVRSLQERRQAIRERRQSVGSGRGGAVDRNTSQPRNPILEESEQALARAASVPARGDRGMGEFESSREEQPEVPTKLKRRGSLSSLLLDGAANALETAVGFLRSTDGQGGGQDPQAEDNALLDGRLAITDEKPWHTLQAVSLNGNATWPGPGDKGLLAASDAAPQSDDDQASSSET